MSLIKKQFGKRLRELRKSVGLTQEQLAEIVSIEPPNLSKIECGMHFPQPEKIEKIANALNVSISELFNFEHLQEKNMLIQGINESLEKFDLQKVELIYKIVTDLRIMTKNKSYKT